MNYNLGLIFIALVIIVKIILILLLIYWAYVTSQIIQTMRAQLHTYTVNSDIFTVIEIFHLFSFSGVAKQPVLYQSKRFHYWLGCITCCRQVLAQEYWIWKSKKKQTIPYWSSLFKHLWPTVKGIKWPGVYNNSSNGKFSIMDTKCWCFFHIKVLEKEGHKIFYVKIMEEVWKRNTFNSVTQSDDNSLMMRIWSFVVNGLNMKKKTLVRSFITAM